MTFELPALPYAKNALEPYISEATLNYHYGKHHQAYVTKLNALIANTPFAEQSLSQIIAESEGGIFNNAAQVFNHTFYWHSMSPNGGGEPTGALADTIVRDFGSIASFKEQFTQAGLNQFGSGWAWLVADHHGKLSILATANAMTPQRQGFTPLLTCDVWEHAYYLDTQNNRAGYIDNFWQCVNWQFAADNLANLQGA